MPQTKRQLNRDPQPPMVSSPQPGDLPPEGIEDLPEAVGKALEAVREANTKWQRQRSEMFQLQAAIKTAAAKDEAAAVKAVEEGKAPPKASEAAAEQAHQDATRATRAAAIAYQNARGQLRQALRESPELVADRRKRMEDHAGKVVAKIEELRAAYNAFSFDAAIICGAIEASQGQLPYFDPGKVLPRTGNTVVDIQPDALLDVLRRYTELFIEEDAGGS